MQRACELVSRKKKDPWLRGAVPISEGSRQPGQKDGSSVASFVMESFANVNGREFQEQRYTARSWRRLLQAPLVGIDSQVYHRYIVSDKARKVRMLHCELKWEMSMYML